MKIANDLITLVRFQPSGTVALAFSQTIIVKFPGLAELVNPFSSEVLRGGV